VPVALGSWLVFGRQGPALRRGLLIVTELASVAALAAVVVNPTNNLIGQQQANVELSRRTSFALTLRAAADYLPFGSGVGSFQPIYHTQEPLDTVTTTYMNHAHSDWIEMLLETGLVGVALAALFVVWWTTRVRAIWRAEESDAFARAAAIASAAIMFHSVVDYPLRTAALSAVFAACVGLMSAARPSVRRSRTLSSARHLEL
jgi:O-antigen ligase